MRTKTNYYVTYTLACDGKTYREKCANQADMFAYADMLKPYVTSINTYSKEERV